jgi:sulfur transfer protein SufE
MNPITCKDVMGVIQSDYGALWHCFQRGNTLEVVTPYLFPDKRFVSVFITTRAGKIIVTDGGRVEEFIELASDDDAFQDSVLNTFLGNYQVQQYQQADQTFYFKDCTLIKLVPSVVFDLCNFIVSVSSASILAVTEEESKERKSFRNQADHYLRSIITNGRKIEFNKNLEEAPEARFSATITGTSKVWLVNYLTGSNLKYFTMSMSNAIVNVGFARESRLNPQIAAIIPLVNSNAAGYKPLKLQHRLEKLEEVSNCKSLLWAVRDLIKVPLEIP